MLTRCLSGNSQSFWTPFWGTHLRSRTFLFYHPSSRGPHPVLTLEVQLGDLLGLVLGGGNLANIGALVLHNEVGESEGGIPRLQQGVWLQGGTWPICPPLIRGPAIHQPAMAMVLQPPLHTGEGQAWCLGEAAVQRG